MWLFFWFELLCRCKCVCVYIYNCCFCIVMVTGCHLSIFEKKCTCKLDENFRQVCLISIVFLQMQRNLNMRDENFCLFCSYNDVTFFTNLTGNSIRIVNLRANFCQGIKPAGNFLGFVNLRPNFRLGIELDEKFRQLF